MENYSILMADIVNSRRASQERLMYEFNSIVEYINSEFKETVLSPLTITLGDEFQGVISDFPNAIQLIPHIEEYIILKDFDITLRYVLNYGLIETKINREIAYGMLGEGLTEAREHLNKIKTSKHRIQILINHNAFLQETLNDLFKIYQNYIDQWSLKERPFLQEFIINNKNYKEVAESLNLNISSSWRRQKTLNIEEYFLVKKLITNLTKKLYV